MGLLTVLIGAGASADCIDPDLVGSPVVADDWRPPLARELFEPRASFYGKLMQYRYATEAAAEIRTYLRNKDNSIEEWLLKANNRVSVNLRKQALEIPFYIQDIIKGCDENYVKSGGTIFSILINKIEEFSKSGKHKVMYLTLNYDTLLEKSLSSTYNWSFVNFDRYINEIEGWSLVKLHGSIDWFYLTINSETNDHDTNFRKLLGITNFRDMFNENCLVIKKDRTGQLFDERFVYPALAAPIAGKDNFICPSLHVKAAQNFLRECQDFLVIGCSVGDPGIQKLLGEVQNARKIWIVNGSIEHSISAFDNIRKFSPAFRRMNENDPDIYHGTFQDFAVEDIDRFLSV